MKKKQKKNSQRTPSNQEVIASSEGSRRVIARRLRLILLACIAVAVVAAIAYVVLQNVNQAQFKSGSEKLEKGDYKSAYGSLKAVDSRGGTAEKDGERGYEYYVTLARAAYLAGNKQDAKQYAVEGIKYLPPEGSDAYTSAQDASLILYGIRDDDYIDYLEYQAGMPLAGEDKE